MEESISNLEQDARDLTFLVNEERGKFAKFFKSFRFYNLIILLVVLAIVTVSVILLFPLGETGMGLALAIIITVLVTVIVYSKLMKRYTNKRGNEYMAFYYKSVSDYVFKDLAVEGYKQDVANQLTFEDFYDAKIFKDITNAGSRNLVTYKIKNFDVKTADYAAYRQEGKKNHMVFVGKLMIVDGLKPCNGRLLVYRRPSVEAIKEAVGPTDVDGLNLVIEDSNLLVYAENDEAKKYLKKSALDALRNFTQKLPFIDMTLSFINSKLTVAISYSDQLMVIPLPEPFEVEATTVLKHNIEDLHKFLELL